MVLRFKSMNKMKRYLLCIAICVMVEIFAGLITQPSIGGWYSTIIKPTFTPPNWLFAPVWILLYLMMGFAWGHIHVVSSDCETTKRANILFVVQLIFNVAWSIFYFGAHSIGYALVDIILLWSALISTIYQFFVISKFAGWLLVPYLLWTSYAAVLNISIWYLNK